MRFRFIGKYTNGHTSVRAMGFVFNGSEPTDVTTDTAMAKIKTHPEFEAVRGPKPKS